MKILPFGASLQKMITTLFEKAEADKIRESLTAEVKSCAINKAQASLIQKNK